MRFQRELETDDQKNGRKVGKLENMKLETGFYLVWG